jgi:Arc/MetJ family transcription regulator
MRTNIVTDDGLMRQAMKATGLSTKKAVVEEGLRLLIKVKGHSSVAGKGWVGGGSQRETRKSR